MVFLSIAVFFIIMWGLGFALLSRTKMEDSFERFSMRLAFGMSLFVVLGVLFDRIGIPLDWKIFTVLAIIFPGIYAIKKRKNLVPKLSLKVKKNQIYSLALLAIFFFSLLMYAGGSFKYPYLEDDDPWGHAIGTEYISTEKTLTDSSGFFKYLDPYPPGYEMTMGVLHQTNDSVYWTLKFFNGLILSLSILFFYFAAKEFTGSKKKALFSTFVLASLPSFFTHFVWAHSLVVLFFFPALYALEKLRKSKRWMLPAVSAIAAILLTQPSQAVKLGIMLLLYFGIHMFYDRKHAIRIFVAGFAGIVVSTIWWFNRILPTFLGKLGRAATSTKARYAARNANIDTSSFAGKVVSFFNPASGSASRPYSFGDFIVAKPYGGINVHVGWGVAISLLLVLGLIFIAVKHRKMLSAKERWVTISLAWFIFTFLGVNAMTFGLPIGFSTFRFWLLLAIPVALLSALGLQLIHSVLPNKHAKLIATLVVIVLIVLTAAYPKYNHNTSPGWPPGVAWTSMDEVQGYAQLTTLPPGTKVFDPSEVGSSFAVGFDMVSCYWCEDELDIRSRMVDLTQAELHTWLKENDYGYMVVGGASANDLIRMFGQEKAGMFVGALSNAINEGELYQIIHSTSSSALVRVV